MERPKEVFVQEEEEEIVHEENDWGEIFTLKCHIFMCVDVSPGY